jgi:Bacterial regulatory proteins, luxR family
MVDPGDAEPRSTGMRLGPEFFRSLDLNISPHTVNTFLRRMYAKLEISSREQLILRVIAEYLAILASGIQESPAIVIMSHAQVTGEEVTLRKQHTGA